MTTQASSLAVAEHGTEAATALADPRRSGARVADYPEFVIAPGGRWQWLDLRELLAYRQLVLFLVWRDLKVRYAQTVLGVGWAILQPLLTTVVFTVIFGRLARVPSDGVAYPAFSLVALVPWTFFSTALTASANSLLNSSHMLKKVYFPRIAMPATPVFVSLVDYGIGFVVAIVVVLAYGLAPGAVALAVVPAATLVLVLAALGLGSWLAALNIQYRDIKHLLPFAVQIAMYASPIVYPLSLIPEGWRPLYALNPVAGAVAAIRGALLGTGVPWLEFGISAAAAVAIFVAGTLYFRRAEHYFADVA